ncbi:MAG: hypothetical protein QOJ69_1335, partial [Actinomycetota bacterium]|nr:hypothetical protein [Actinomycetota bacterium]
RKYAVATTDADLLGLLRALADPTRLRLFLALHQAERCVRDLVDEEGIPQPLVSHHLRVLARAGLVETRRADGFVFYALSPDGMAGALAVLSEILDPAGVGPAARPGGNQACCK